LTERPLSDAAKRPSEVAPRQAQRVGPGGVVFANDISTSGLDVIRERADREGLKNIRMVVGAVEDPLFPAKNLDMVVMVYVLHLLERPIPFLKNLHAYLRPGASLVIIERNTTVERAHSPSFMTNRLILETMNETGAHSCIVVQGGTPQEQPQ